VVAPSLVLVLLSRVPDNHDPTHVDACYNQIDLTE
jgi:hypothetical protein